MSRIKMHTLEPRETWRRKCVSFNKPACVIWADQPKEGEDLRVVTKDATAQFLFPLSSCDEFSGVGRWWEKKTKQIGAETKTLLEEFFFFFFCYLCLASSSISSQFKFGASITQEKEDTCHMKHNWKSGPQTPVGGPIEPLNKTPYKSAPNNSLLHR